MKNSKQSKNVEAHFPILKRATETNETEPALPSGWAAAPSLEEGILQQTLELYGIIELTSDTMLWHLCGKGFRP